MDKVESGFVLVSCLVLLVLVGLIFAEVISRKVFGRSIYVSLEYSEYGLAFIMAFTLFSVNRRKSHLVVEVLSSRLPDRARKIVDLIFFAMVFLCYNLVITYLCYALFSQSLALKSLSQGVAHTPMWIPQLIVFLGVAASNVGLITAVTRKVSEFSRQSGESDQTRKGGGR